MAEKRRIFDDFFILAASNPSPQQILDYKASPEDERNIKRMIEKSKSGTTTPREQAEIEYFLKVEGTILLAKTKAFVDTKNTPQE